MTIIAKFRALRHLRFEDTKRIMSPEMRPKSFGTSEKQTLGQRSLLFPRLHSFFSDSLNPIFNKVLL